MVQKSRTNDTELIKITEYLKNIGVSRDASEMYLFLLRSKPQTMSQLADVLHNHPSANYRLAYELEELGLIYKLSGRPMRYEAYPLTLGLEASFRTHLSNLGKIVSLINTNITDAQSQMELIVGRRALYERYEALATQANKEIVVFTIGIAFSRSLLSVQKSAIKRGVSIRHVVQRVKADNFYIINQWKQIGVKLRYAPSEKGFHLMIFDRDKLLLSFSDPDNTENRISILTDNKTALRLFFAQFQTIWGNAKEIEEI